uniref:E3 ubiquitin-protein ligase MSL2 n=1 Tax=Electrophorus electricus TaxID=8005 RepID=A0A4W4H0C4_ELEEL
MNPVNATTLYVSACRSVLQCDPRDPQSLTELYKLLPFFRQSLSCLVCGNLLQDPIAPTNSSCQHYVCKACKGKKMMMKPSCSWCKDYDQFEENKQLCILVDCYRKLCEYIAGSSLAPHISNAAGGSPDILALLNEGLSLDSSNMDELAGDLPSPHTGDIKHDGGSLLLSVEEVLRTLEPDPVPQDECPAILQPGLEVLGNGNGAFDCAAAADPPRRLSSLPFDSAAALAPQHPASQQNPQPSSGISCSAITPRVPRSSRKRSRSESDSEKIQPLPISTIIRGPALGASVPVPVKCEPKAPAQAAPHLVAVPNGGGLSKVGKALLVPSKSVKKSLDQHGPKKAYAKSKQGTPKSKDKTKERLAGNSLVPGSPTKVVYKKPQEKKGCKCGRATQNPSVLTCRGQRCPCYSNRKACLDCICRGCQNSYMANGEKKLEAFAVPEKALEQTRLTLGINVTSIAVRNAGSGGGGAAGVLNVAAATGSPVTSFLSAGPHEDKGFDESLDMRFDC